jgi:hypothetical protein
MQIFMLRLFRNKKSGQYFILMSFLFVLEAKTCSACYAPPREQLIDVDEQIMKSRDVSVVQVVSAVPTRDGNTEYNFVVQKRVSGFTQENYTLKSRFGEGRDEESSFGNHEDKEFWGRGGGRLTNDTDCVIYPKFVVGNSYLAFFGQTLTRRSFEKIDNINGQPNMNDRWLRYVENKIRIIKP